MPTYEHKTSNAWLGERLQLFARYCLPGLRAQTVKAFHWLIFFDSDSPIWFRDRINELASGSFTPVWVTGTFDSDVVRDALPVRNGTSHVITTRLDNDDAVATDFIETIHGAFDKQDLEFVNLVNGAQLANERVYLRPYTRNPFVSLIEAVNNDQPFQTVFSARHYEVDTVAAVRNIKTSHPMWLQVIHGDNVLNEVVGVRTRTSRITPWFTCELPVEAPDFAYYLERFRGGVRVAIRLVRKPKRIRDLLETIVARPVNRS